MSVQETKLKAIADAIRAKDGTTEPIPANDFADRILALETGGSLPDNVRTISLTADPPEGGTVSGGGVAQEGMTLTINAEPDEDNNYYFDGWKENDAVVSAEPVYTFPVTADRALIAAFLQSQYTPGVDWWESTLPWQRATPTKPPTVLMASPGLRQPFPKAKVGVMSSLVMASLSRWQVLVVMRPPIVRTASIGRRQFCHQHSIGMVLPLEMANLWP